MQVHLVSLTFFVLAATIPVWPGVGRIAERVVAARDAARRCSGCLGGIVAQADHWGGTIDGNRREVPAYPVRGRKAGEKDTLLG